MPLPYATSLAVAQPLYEGMLHGTAREVQSRFASAAIRAGLLVQRSTTAVDQVDPMAALVAADPDSIVTLASAITAVVAGQTVQDVAGAVGGVLDGVIGPGRIMAPRSLTATFNASANWGLAALGGTWCYFEGLDPEGNLQKEDFFLPAGGNIVITSNKAFSKHIATYIGACDGAGGGATVTIGTSNGTLEQSRLDYGIALYERARDPQQIAATYGLTTDTTFIAREPLDVLYDGTVAVVVEATAALAVAVGDPVAVRTVAAGADVRGQFTRYTSPDLYGGNYSHLSNAVWASTGVAGGLALLRIWR